MKEHPDVAIIGGGIIGLTSAYLLAKRGLGVAIYERGETGQEASWAGAGIIPPGNVAGAATAIDQLRAIGSERFPGFSKHLLELTGIDNGYWNCGAIEFLEEHEEGEVSDLWRREGIVFEKLSPAELVRVEPGSGDAPGVPYFLPGCAQVRNPRHLRALAAACRQAGVAIHVHRETTSCVMGPDGRQVQAIEVDGERHSAGCFVIAAGAWSERLLKPLGATPGVHPVLGQIVLLSTPPGLLQRILMVGKRYLVPRPDGRVLIGSTEEPEAGFEKANTMQATRELLGFAHRLVPALTRAEVVKTWAGLRPGSRDGLPYIGKVPGVDNAFVATGHFRAGVQLSLGTAETVLELVTGQRTSVDLESFALDRPPRSAGVPAFRS
jgi:glycine oxidase